MRSLVFVVPGRLEAATGGYVYDRHIIEELRRQGWLVEVRTLDETFPFPTASALDHAARILAQVPASSRVLIDGLAFGAMPDIVEREASRLHIAALVHLPLAADITLDAATAAQLVASEGRALRAASLVVVTGRRTLALLRDYQLAPEKTVVVEPGTRRVAVTRAPTAPPVTLLSVATLHPGKGHEILLNALAALRDLDWELICVGSVTRHPQTTDRVRATIARLGLEGRVLLAGELDEARLCRMYARADVFVLATLQETYGMAVAEALSHGLPVVATITGAISDMVGADAGLLVPPGDAAELTSALRRIVADADLRATLARGAANASERLPSWEDAGRRMAHALDRLGEHG